MAIIKKINNKCGKEVEKREPWCTVDGNINWYRCYGKQYGGSLKNYLPEESKTVIQENYVHPYVYYSIICNVQVTEATEASINR